MIDTLPQTSNRNEARTNARHVVVSDVGAIGLTPAQQVAVEALPPTRTVRRSRLEGVATVYVYHQMSVVRHLIDDGGTVISSEQFRAGNCDREIRQQLLADQYGTRAQEGLHGNH